MFPLSLLSWPPLFVSSPSISPRSHSIRSQVSYLLVSQRRVPSVALQPELTVDWLVALHSSPLIMLKWSRFVRPKIHFPWARERRGGGIRDETGIKFSEVRWRQMDKRNVKAGQWMEREEERMRHLFNVASSVFVPAVLAFLLQTYCTTELSGQIIW